MAGEYSRARKLAEKEYKSLTAHGIYPFVPALEQMIPDVYKLSRTPLGIMEIPSDMIGGTLTETRQNGFSASWLPLMEEGTEFAYKWDLLYEAQLSEGIREPIKVVEYMRRFYVIEGNKRVSVLRYLGAPVIEADVSRILPAANDTLEYRIYQEFLRFYQVTGIYELGFSNPGDYQKLADLLDADLEHPWPPELCDAVSSAYHRFAGLYRKRDGLDLDMGMDDAFLLYLHYFPLDSFTYADDASLVRRLGRIRRELRTEQNRNRITYVESADKADSPSGSVPLLKKLKGSGYSASNPLRIAFLHDGDPQTSLHTNSHEEGRLALEERFGALVQTYAYYDTLNAGPYADASEAHHRYQRFDHAIDDALSKGCRVIFTTSPALLPEVQIAALQHPDVRFLNCSINLSHSAIRCYECRMYEVKFIMGTLAASFAENHQIGYLAGTPSYDSIAGINAFAIGASMTDPDSRVHLAWRTEDGTDWRAKMREAGVSVFSDSDFVTKSEAAANHPYGLYTTRTDGIRPLARPLINWGRYYELITLSLLHNRYDTSSLYRHDRALNYWLGIADGVVDVLPAETLPYSSRNLIEYLRSAFRSGILDPFDGELHSQEALIRRAGDPPFSRDDILTMDWLNENVVGRIPPISSLNETAKTVVSLTGVAKE